MKWTHKKRKLTQQNYTPIFLAFFKSLIFFSVANFWKGSKKVALAGLKSQMQNSNDAHAKKRKSA